MGIDEASGFRLGCDMRQISGAAIAQFAVMTTTEAVIALVAAVSLVSPSVPVDYRGVAVVASSVLLFYGLAIAGFALLQRWAPVPSGAIAVSSAGEHRAFAYMLHFILLFNPLIFGRFMPFPLLGLVLRMLGLKMGQNSYCAGLVMDPPFVRIGDNSIIGNDAMLIAHVIEGDELGYYPIQIGNNVTVGARAIIMAGVTIEDGAIVGVQSVVKKGTHIRSGETWIGSPARRLDRAAGG